MSQKIKNGESIMNALKEKLEGLLGTAGCVLFFVIRLIVCLLPFVMIGGGFFITFVLIAIQYFIPLSTAVFWIWGLVCAIQGVQDIWAIVYYIAFTVIWIPSYISTISSLFSKSNRY